MLMTLERFDLTSDRTIGRLRIGGQVECFTLEDAVRDVKIPGKTAIPAGLYTVVVTWSPKFKVAMPLLLNVPDFTGVRIHWGNTARDTEGCILVGQRRGGDDTIEKSRLAYDALLPLIVAATRDEGVMIDVRNPAPKRPATEVM